MGAAPGDLTSLASAKQYLAISDSQADALVQQLITGASAFIQAMASRTFASTDYTDTFDGRGKNKIPLKNYPVTAVSAVTVDGVSIPAATNVLASGFLFDQYTLMLRHYRFSPGMQNIVVEYTAGLATTPADLDLATCELVALKYNERKRQGVTSQTIAGQIIIYKQTDVPPSVQSVIDNYTRRVPVV